MMPTRRRPAGSAYCSVSPSTWRSVGSPYCCAGAGAVCIAGCCMVGRGFVWVWAGWQGIITYVGWQARAKKTPRKAPAKQAGRPLVSINKSITRHRCPSHCSTTRVAAFGHNSARTLPIMPYSGQGHAPRTPGGSPFVASVCMRSLGIKAEPRYIQATGP